MKSIYRSCLVAVLAVAVGGSVCEAQNTDKEGVAKSSRRVVRVTPDAENAEVENKNRRIVRVFSTSDGTEDEDGGPGAYSYTYGLARKRGFLGVQLTDLTPELRAHFGAPEDAGVLISEVADESPAAAAGLRVGDVLTAIDGDSITTGFDVARRVSAYEDGATVVLEVWRDRSLHKLSAAIVERERTAIDLGRFVLPDSVRLREGLEIDFEKLPEHIIEIDEEGIHKALLDLRLKFEDPKMIESFEVLGRNRLDLQERINELELRLKELEQQLEKLHDD